MRKIGLILLIAGFFGAAFYSVYHVDDKKLEWKTIEWVPYAVFFVVGVVGVVILRTIAARQAVHGEKVSADMQTLAESLGRIAERLARLSADRAAIGVYDVHKRIEEEFTEDIGRFVDARETLVPVCGLQAYAKVMSDFAAGERAINRAWCASADGYIDEVWACIERAESLMATANRTLRTVQQAAVPR